MSECPDGGRCGHGCEAACWRVLTCSPLTSHGDDWTDEEKAHAVRLKAAEELTERHDLGSDFERTCSCGGYTGRGKHYDEFTKHVISALRKSLIEETAWRGELQSEVSALIPVKQAWVDRGKQIDRLRPRALRASHLAMVLRSFVGSVDSLQGTANRKPSSLVHVHKSVLEYARSTLAAIDEEDEE